MDGEGRLQGPFEALERRDGVVERVERQEHPPQPVRQEGVDDVVGYLRDDSCAAPHDREAHQ